MQNNYILKILFSCYLLSLTSCWFYKHYWIENGSSYEMSFFHNEYYSSKYHTFLVIASIKPDCYDYSYRDPARSIIYYDTPQYILDSNIVKPSEIYSIEINSEQFVCYRYKQFYDKYSYLDILLQNGLVKKFRNHRIPK